MFHVSPLLCTVHFLFFLFYLFIFSPEEASASIFHLALPWPICCSNSSGKTFSVMLFKWFAFYFIVGLYLCTEGFLSLC